MKLPSLLIGLLACAFSASAQWAQFKGDFLGIAIPSSRCSNERLTMNIIAEDDGNVSGSVVDWTGRTVAVYRGRLATNGRAGGVTGDVFAEDYDPLAPGVGWTMRLKISARGGTMRGTLDGSHRSGCKYSFALHRQFKIAQ